MTAISPEFAKALVKAQGAIGGAVKGKENTFFKDQRSGKASKYADLSACWDACDEALQANNIAVLQPVVTAPPGYVGIKTVLVYGPTGDTLEEVATFPVKDPTNPQAVGSAVTYGRRYSLCSWLGICPEDDDGNAAAKAEKAPRPPQTQAPVVYTLAQFEKTLDDIDAAKAFYSTVKNSAMQEPAKTELLSKMAAAIKGMK